MTLKKFRILCLFVFLAVYIPTVILAPLYVVNTIMWCIAGWQIGGWVSELSYKLADKFGYSE